MELDRDEERLLASVHKGPRFSGREWIVPAVCCGLLIVAAVGALVSDGDRSLVAPTLVAVGATIILRQNIREWRIAYRLIGKLDGIRHESSGAISR